MQKPKFSIIIPSHNGEKCLGRCLDSVITQTILDYEILVIADACTDKTVEVAKKYPVKLFEVDFKRDGLTRNVGLDNACGDWILFLDHDDWWLHEYVLSLLNIQTIKHPDMDVLYFSFIWSGMGYYRQTTEHNYIAVWNKMYKRSFIGDTRFTDIPNWSDKDFTEALNNKIGNRLFWDMPMYYYNYLYEGSINARYAAGLTE